MPQTDPVILKLEADIRDYNVKISEAQRLTDTKLDAIEKRGERMGRKLKDGFNVAKAAAVAYIAAVGVQAVTGAISQGLEYASALGEQAQQLGVTTNALQEYRYAATQVGLSAEEMDGALSQLTRRIGEGANGTKAQAEAFNALGVSLKDAEGNILNAGEAIPLIADGLAKIESPAQRAAILMDLFGRAGQKLEPLLSGGSAAVNQLRNAAHSLGVVLSERQIQQADETADKLAELNMVLRSNIAGAVSSNASSILALANALGQVVIFAGKAAEAYKRWMLEVGVRQRQNTIDGWFSSSEAKARATAERDAMQAELDRMKPKGGLRNYNKNPIGSTPMIDVNGGAGGAFVPNAVAGGGGGEGGGGGPSGPSAAELRNRLDSQLASYAQQALSSMQSVAKSADERAELELRSVELSRIRAQAETNVDKELSAAAKARISAAIEDLAERERERVEFQRVAENERNTADLAEARYSIESQSLRDAYDLADSRTERRKLSGQMLDLEYRHRDALLAAIIASETAGEAEKERARIIREGLAGAKAGDVARADREAEGPLARRRRELNNPDRVGDQVEGYVLDELDRVQDSISDAISKKLGVKNPFLASLLDLFFEQQLIRPLLDKLAGAQGGGGGLLGLAGSFFGGLFGRASGGYVGPGQMVRVNEGASPGRVEGFMASTGGKIVPLGRMNAATGGGSTTIVQHIAVDARNSVNPEGFERRILSISAQQAQGAYAAALRDGPVLQAKRSRYG